MDEGVDPLGGDLDIRTRRLNAGIKNDLDGLSEANMERLAERHKFKGRQERRDDKRCEDWSGVSKSGAQIKTEEEDECDYGDEMVQLKAKGDDSDSSADRKDVDFVTLVGQTQAARPAQHAQEEGKSSPGDPQIAF